MDLLQGRVTYSVVPVLDMGDSLFKYFLNFETVF
jgi:hypothetical protein